MATPMTPDQRLAAFGAEGLPVVEIPGWRTNDRTPVTGLPSSPRVGTLNHHTGGDTSDPRAYAAGILFQGRSDLPGPLCHEGLDVDRGVIYMVGSGRANHAGSGDPDTLNLYLNDAMPLDREVRPDQSTGSDGNRYLYGLEAMYSGLRDLPRVGYVAMVKWNVAYCRFHGWTGKSAGGHREWTNQKPDPGHVDLAQLRRDIDAALALPPGVWGSTVTPPPSEEDDMPYTPEQIIDLAAKGATAALRSEGASGGGDPHYNGNEKVMAILGALPDDIAAKIKVPSPDPKVIADAVLAALPDDLAQEVVDELSTRLGSQRQAAAPEAAPADAVGDLPDCANPDDPNNA